MSLTPRLAALIRSGAEASLRPSLDPRGSSVIICGSRVDLASDEQAVRLRQLSSTDCTNGKPDHVVRFVAPGEPADVTALVVTYNSAAVIDPLISDLRRVSSSLRLRCVVIDNASDDDTVALIEAHPDLTCVCAPGNTGYAAGINLGMREVGDSRALLVLNPDVRLQHGSIDALWRRLWQPGVEAVVPRIQNRGVDGFDSIRREPSVLRTLGDALLGSKVRNRPAWLGEIDYNEGSYQQAHPIDWATGACLLMRGSVAERIGPWDERFFLYSEEVDYMRRIRASCGEVWYEPAAVVCHERQGGSGASPQLAALCSVNRVRYVRKWQGFGRAEAVRAASALGSPDPHRPSRTTCGAPGTALGPRPIPAPGRRCAMATHDVGCIGAVDRAGPQRSSRHRPHDLPAVGARHVRSGSSSSW